MVDVRLNEIRKSYQGKLVVSDLNMHVQDGEYVVLLGASGCGKTSVLKIIAGLESPDQGDIFLGQQRITGLAPRKRDIAMVFQDDALYPHMTVRKLIGFALARKLSTADLKQRIDDAVAMTNIELLLDRMPENLSGGESRRVAIAKAMARRASVRLLDEPLSGLDANVRGGIQDALLHWHRKTPGTTIHVTHDGQEAMRVADRIAVMDQGKIVQFAAPSEIYHQPATKTVALAIGSPPMNFLPVQVRNGKVCFQSKNAEVVSAIDIPESVASEIQVGFRDRFVQVVADDESISRPGILLTGTLLKQQALDGRCRLSVELDAQTRVNATQEKQTTKIQGESIRLFWALEHLMFFDSRSGENLTGCDSTGQSPSD